MFKLFRGRTVNFGDRYKVYRNLNNDMFSLLAVDGEFKGKVVAHAESVILHDVQFMVSEPSRIRACREGIRNVHAFAIGTVSAFKRDTGNDLAGLSPITYNPFLHSTFIFLANNKPVTSAAKVMLQHGKAYARPIDYRQLPDLPPMRT